MLRTILIALCACATFAYAQPEKPETKPEEKPAMELGVNVKDGIYWAFEFAHVVDKNNWKQGYQEIALQIGLRQTLQLPGFQRRTLATE